MIQGKEQTITVRVSRDDVAATCKSKNEVIIGGFVMKKMREAGIPIIGVLAPFCVEYGTLVTTIEEGLDGDEFVYKWTGVPIPRDMRHIQFTFSQCTLRGELAERAAKQQEDEM